MRYFIIVPLLVTLPFSALKAQKMHEGIKSKIKGADSVWLITHETTGIYMRHEDDKDTEVILVEKGKLHKELIRESVLLNTNDKTVLAKMLSRPSTSYRVEMATCFFGEHAIVWKKGKKFSCIDIAFSCHRLRETVDVENSFPEFDNSKWKELEDFFKKKGVANQF